MKIGIDKIPKFGNIERMIKQTFEIIERHCGSQREAAKFLHIALSTYQLWKKRGDDLAEKHKQYLQFKADEI